MTTTMNMKCHMLDAVISAVGLARSYLAQIIMPTSRLVEPEAWYQARRWTTTAKDLADEFSAMAPGDPGAQRAAKYAAAVAEEMEWVTANQAAV